jgi:DNA-binding response OmpR family regulator
METIYVIEDDLDTADAIKHYLERHNFDVRCFKDFETTLENLDGPCVILMDICVPSLMTPDEFVWKVRNRQPKITIVLLSGSPDIQEVALRLGADGWVKKPYDIDDIVRLAAEHCERSTP